MALAEVEGMALAELDRLEHPGLDRFPPHPAARADLLHLSGRRDEAASAYTALLALDVGDAERRWLERRMNGSSSPRA